MKNIKEIFRTIRIFWSWPGLVVLFIITIAPFFKLLASFENKNKKKTDFVFFDWWASR